MSCSCNFELRWHIFLGVFILIWKMFLVVGNNLHAVKFPCLKSRTNCETCSKLIIKTPKWLQWLRFSVFIVTLEHTSHFSTIFVANFQQVNAKQIFRYLVFHHHNDQHNSKFNRHHKNKSKWLYARQPGTRNSNPKYPGLKKWYIQLPGI